jgi:DnaJ-class molecular chaperone
MDDSFYNVLGLSEQASQDEIKKAFRKLSLINHPDKNPNDPLAVSKFQKITEAYETLGDEEKRRNYDMTRQNPFSKMMGPGGNMGGPFGFHANPDNVQDIFSNLFGMGMHFGGMPRGMPFGPGVHFGDVDGPNIRIFHNGVPINKTHCLEKPTPIVQTINIQLDKVLTGATVPVDIERWIIENGNKIFEKETLYVNIIKGIDDNEIIILRDKGNVVNEHCKGDVKIFVKIENNSDFKRMGLDLVLDKKITLKEALCGFSFDLKYINGKIYTINNNKGNIIPNGYKKLIPNMGLTRDEHTGNLIIIFLVEFPEKIETETLDAIQKLNF